MKQLTKKHHIMLIALGIFFVFYNVILFTISGFTGLSAAFWFSYVFMLAAIALNIAARSLLFRDKDRITAKDWFFGYPVLRHGYIYLIVEFIASTLFMVIPNCSAKVAVVVQLLILAAYLVFAVSCLFAKETIEELDERIKDKVLFVRSMQVDLQTIASRCADPVTGTMIKKLAEKMRLSDPMSHETLFELEKDIALEISRLKSDVEQRSFDTAKERYTDIDQLLDERNRKCKILK